MAAANAERAIALILHHEGGLADHPADPGGITNRGVTIHTAKALGIDKDGDGDTDRQDVMLLTEADAIRVFDFHYWDKVRADELPAGVDYCTADAAVNSGPRRGAIWLQRALGVKADGKVGPVTLAAARTADPHVTIDRMCDDRLAFLRRLSTWGTFGKGWTRRVEDVRREAKAMASPAPRPTAPVPPPSKRQTGWLAAILAVIAGMGAWMRRG